MRRYTLEIIAFFSGASVMVLEIVGSRILAPYLGTSVFVWTSLIGVVLASLSLGYWWGGHLSDRKPDPGVLALVLFLAAAWTGLLSLWSSPALIAIVSRIPDVRTGAVVAALVQFFVPSVLMGMVSPYAVRLKMRTVTDSGTTVGGLYAVSTIGSIIGTFAAGFVLIPLLPNPHILLIVALTLGATSLLAGAGRLRTARAAGTGALALLLFFPPGLDGKVRDHVLDVNTLYSRVWIYDLTLNHQGRDIDVRCLRIGNQGSGAMFLDSWAHAYDYTRYFDLYRHFNPGAKKTLMIGGGAYAYVLIFLHDLPPGTMDVVEIDPKVTELAREYFFLEDDPRLRIFHEDGRIFLNRTRDVYDAVFIDAFNSHSYIPHHMVTVEALERVKGCLTPEGVVLANIIGILDGEGSNLVRAVTTTFREVFPQVHLFAVDDPELAGTAQNIMLVASNSAVSPPMTSEDPVLQDLLKNRWTGEVPSLIVLRDDYSPVDRYVLEAAPKSMSPVAELMRDLEKARPPTSVRKQ